MADPQLIVQRDGPIGWLIFSNVAKHNAMTFEMWRGVPEVIAGLAEDPEIRILALKGAGEKAFVSGADISEFETRRGSSEAQMAYNAAADAATAIIQTCPKPTLAMVRGYCIGGGLALALACDLRFAAEGTRFAIPAARLGLGYRYAGMRRLVDVVGPSRAKDIFYSARQFDTAEALSMGLINRIVPKDALEEEVRAYGTRVAANAPLTIAAAKLAIDAATTEPGPDALAAIDRAIKACFASEDYREGPIAFREKRPPNFKGR
ncbi:enoyl-CoA hydratase [Methylobacterium mesophilicum SR1.6/6]|uniref:Enoyl-CoA hydratase n=1 Tax=Methylobacterium mesophilicum SR1.6/6 TaxID=908290 RepID=A0A6B9FUC1_9HYPH|nr:enoyl-CoA hydratase [Methylobacterium mesophilicum]QGY05356.1 enoyl-CoA hydratase [Methylobacterium mesophilicum SR1.6/6]